MAGFNLNCVSCFKLLAQIGTIHVNVELHWFTADYSPFLGIEKGAVLQEARVFNDPQLDPRRCSQVFPLHGQILSLHMVQLLLCSYGNDS